MREKVTVCIRRKPWDSERISVGLPGKIHPVAKQAFEDDDFLTWETSAACCKSCGEMLGVSRGKYRVNRWPVRVNDYKCVKCGAQVCDSCALWVQTNEVAGEYRRRSREGGKSYMAPVYRLHAYCAACNREREENLPPPEPSTSEKLLKRLGLL